MAYERINWQNEPSEATALNDVNLNKMDSAIYELDGKATTTETAITDLQDGKVDKVNGKGLSQVDNVTVTQHVAYGTVVSTIKTYGQDGTEVTSQVCNGIVVDSALSNSSTNPVQNKVVKSAIDEKSTVAISDTLETGTTLANITIDGTTTAIKGSDIEVDEELSPTSTNPVENKAIYDALNNLLPSKTVSGNPIAISDASGFNAKALTVTMNPIQDLHGYSNPWVGGAGKNKFSCVDHLNPSSNLSATKNADGSVRIYGTPNGTWGAVSDLTDCNLPAGQYTFSIQSAVAYNIYTQCYVGGTNTNRTVNAGQTYITFTVSGTITKIRLMISGMTVNTPVDVTIKPMLASGTAATFAPYSNICPISGRTEASVKRTGANLYGGEVFKDEVVEQVPSATVTTNTVVFGAGSVSGKKFCTDVKFKQNTAYTFRMRCQNNQANANTNLRVYYTDGTYLDFRDNSQSTANVDRNIVITTNANKTIQELRGVNQAGNTTVYLDSFGVFEGTRTFDDFEPYTAETHTHQYQQEIYGGVDDFVNGGATSTIAMVDLGTLTWTYDATYNRFSSNGILDAKVPQTARTTAFSCSCYEVISDGRPISQVTNNSIYQAYGGGGTYATLCINDDRFTDPTDLVNAISGQTATYELKTPTTISTSPERITLFKGNNVLSTNADDMELKYSVSLDSLLPTE